MQWTWDWRKNRANKRNHKLSFETATLVFNDPHAASQLDPNSDEWRWQTIGLVGGVTVLVIHTHPEPDPATGRQVGRIISARRATPRERRAYEEGIQ